MLMRIIGMVALLLINPLAMASVKVEPNGFVVLEELFINASSQKVYEALLGKAHAG